MYIINDGSHVPGRIRSVPSTRMPGVRHWGVEGWDRDANGHPTIWHAQKNDVLRCTSYVEFTSGQPSKIEASPESFTQQSSVIQRLQNIEGLRWDLTTANCEQVVRWAYEGKAHSEQLTNGVAILLFVGLLRLLALAS
jgi:hypothetical protein